MLLPLTAILAVGHFQASPLLAHAPIAIPGKAGKFDFMGIDPENRLLAACHPGNSALAVLNLNTKKAVDVGLGTEVNGVAFDPKGKRIFAAGPGKTFVALNSAKLTILGRLPLDGPGDCVQFDPGRGVVYVDNDDGTNLWVINPKSMKLTGKVTIKEAPEYMEFDASHDRIFQAIKSTSTVQVINPKTLEVEDEWKLGALTSPHGLAIDRFTHTIFVAGKNGELVLLDSKSGTLLDTVEVVKGSDQIAYDPSLRRVYIPAAGTLQIIQITGNKGKMLGEVPVSKDCKRVVVDPKTHVVWVAYSEGNTSYFQSFAPQ